MTAVIGVRRDNNCRCNVTDDDIHKVSNELDMQVMREEVMTELPVVEAKPATKTKKEQIAPKGKPNGDENKMTKTSGAAPTASVAQTPSDSRGREDRFSPVTQAEFESVSPLARGKATLDDINAVYKSVWDWFHVETYVYEYTLHIMTGYRLSTQR